MKQLFAWLWTQDEYNWVIKISVTNKNLFPKLLPKGECTGFHTCPMEGLWGGLSYKMETGVLVIPFRGYKGRIGTSGCSASIEMVPHGVKKFKATPTKQDLGSGSFQNFWWAPLSFLYWSFPHPPWDGRSLKILREWGIIGVISNDFTNEIKCRRICRSQFNLIL